MKIVCIGRNYGAHAKELGNTIPEEPVVFLKPQSALVPVHGPITLPKFSRDVHHEIELVFVIGRKNGKVIADKVTIGLDLTARDVQLQLKEKGLPWEKAKAFDGSAYVSDTRSAMESFPAGHHIDFMLKKNGHPVQSGHSGQMIFDVATCSSPEHPLAWAPWRRATGWKGTCLASCCSISQLKAALRPARIPLQPFFQNA